MGLEQVELMSDESIHFEREVRKENADCENSSEEDLVLMPFYKSWPRMTCVILG